MSGTADTLTPSRKLEAADLLAFEKSLTVTFYRASWIQAVGIVAAITVLTGITIGLASLWSGQ